MRMKIENVKEEDSHNEAKVETGGIYSICRGVGKGSVVP